MKNVIKIILLFVVLQSVAHAGSKVTIDHISKGKAHFRNGFYQLAPKHRQTEAKLQYAKAIKELKQAIAISPDNEIAYRLLARVYTVQQQAKEAAEAYKKVIALNPGDVDTYVFAALALFESQQYNEAITTLQTAKKYAKNKAVLLKIDSYLAKIKAFCISKGVPDVKY